jgi:hypothetical protein
MNAAKITLFLLRGEAKSLRTAEIGNWTGMALAAPRTELDDLLKRPELDRAGIYILTGTDPNSGQPLAYIGEAEIIRERLKQQKTKEFWVSSIVFISKDENLNKAHIRFLESKLFAEASQVGRFKLDQNEAGGARLAECERANMETFLTHVRQLLPLLGSDLLSPASKLAANQQTSGTLLCCMKRAKGRGHATPDGFVVLKGSTAVLDGRPKSSPYVTALRNRLIEDGTLVQSDGLLKFTRDYEFTSPSAAAGVIEGGQANGLIDWRTEGGTVLKNLEAHA